MYKELFQAVAERCQKNEEEFLGDSDIAYLIYYKLMGGMSREGCVKLAKDNLAGKKKQSAEALVSELQKAIQEYKDAGKRAVYPYP